MPRIISFGEALIDVFATPGLPLRDAKNLHPRPGGAPANVAVALARLGSEVGFIGKVGADEYGAFLIDLLAEEGVDVTHFIADSGGPTMLAIVAAPSPSEQNFILYHGADALLRSKELPKAYIESAAVFVFGSVTLTAESRAATVQAARWAKEAGNQVIFDVNLRPLLWRNLESARLRIQESVACATVVKLNESELDFLTGTADPVQGSRQILAQGIRLCCVSLGADGAYFNNGGASGHIPAFEVEVLDTTGSGDAFVAGLAHGLSELRKPVENLDEPTLRRMITFANACGGLAATRLGAMSALPAFAEVERLLGSTT
jgi:fructokinase